MPGKQVGMRASATLTVSRYHSQPLLLRGEQPVRGDDRQETPTRLPSPLDAARRTRALQGPEGAVGRLVVPGPPRERGPRPVHRQSIIAAARPALDKDQEFPDVEFDSRTSTSSGGHDRRHGLPAPHGDRVAAAAHGPAHGRVPPTAEEAIATLVSIAEIDWPRTRSSVAPHPRERRGPKPRRSTATSTRASQDVELLQKITQGTELL